MLIINFHVFQEGAILKVRLDLIQDARGDTHRHLMDVKFDDIDNRLNLWFLSFKSHLLPSIQFKAHTVNAEGKKILSHLKQSSIVYDLPNMPSAAILWLDCMCTYVCKISYPNLTGVFFRNSSINKYNKPGYVVKMSKYLDLEDFKNRAMLKLIKEILKFETMTDYKLTMLAIARCHEIYRGFTQVSSKRAFSACLDKEFSDYIFWNETEENLLNTESDHANKLKFFINFIKSNIEEYSVYKINSNNFTSFNNKLKRLNFLAKRRLFAPCVGVLSHEGITEFNPAGTYNWDAPEWKFILTGDFRVREGRMHIVNGETNKFPFFKEKMEFLVKIMGLEFDVNCDFDKEIMFTKESTNELISLGLHLNVSYAKHLLQADHSWRMYNQLSNSSLSPFHLFHQLPPELSAMIVSQVHPPISYLDETLIGSEILSMPKIR